MDPWWGGSTGTNDTMSDYTWIGALLGYLFGIDAKHRRSQRADRLRQHHNQAAEALAVDDGEAARPHLEALARAGDTEAQFELGILAYQGTDDAADPTAAAHWFQLAAEGGMAIAQYNYAMQLTTGDGITQDMTAAVRWFRQAAEQGYLPAQTCLGGHLIDGDGCVMDREEGLHWCRLAAEQGEPAAQVILGRVYSEGLGVTPDPALAELWYRRGLENAINNPELHALAQEGLRLLSSETSED